LPKSKPFQLSLIFVGKAIGLCLRGVTERVLHSGRLLSYLQIIGQPGKVLPYFVTLSLIMKEGVDPFQLSLIFVGKARGLT